MAGPVAASPGVEIGLNLTWGSYPPGGYLTGSIEFFHDEYIPDNARLEAYINGSLVYSTGAGGLLPGISNYSFPSYAFSYDLTSSGNNTWMNYTDQLFDYSIMVNGTCGDRDTCCNVTESRCWCDCSVTFCRDYQDDDPSTIPCYWEVTYPQGWRSSSVKGSEGLKLIDDFSDMVKGNGLPGGENEEETVWAETTNTDPSYVNYNPDVITTMRKACGGDTYEGWQVGQDGWVHERPLAPDSWEKDGAHHYSIIERFDHSSLSGNRGLYVDSDIGGVYKDGNYLPYSETASLNTAFWNGTSGDIKLYYYDDQATYTITYLPPNGPMVCAYTGFYTGGSEEWTESVGPFQNRQTRYDAVFSVQHGVLDFPLAGQPKSCPSHSGDCQQDPVRFGAVLTSDPSGTVALDFDEATYTVTASTTSRMMTLNYTDTIDLRDAFSISSDSMTDHLLRVDLTLAGELLASDNVTFGVCTDADHDYECSISEGGGDCDDSNPLFRSTTAEECDGMDNDCDGIADEGFFLDFKEMGTICGGSPNSSCRGTWRCSLDGSGAICDRDHDPGDLVEICGTGVDEDCDGEIDEVVSINGDPACWCEPGDKDVCGSNIGICIQGDRICAIGISGYPEWSECRNAVGGRTEACNRLDDDCDGIVDDVYGGSSITTSKCGCFGGISPTPEICNDIDDDCNGEIDNGVSCCTDGDTRACGTDVGQCEKGTQECVSGSWQVSECKDAVLPEAEICYNKEDDDCDGQMDEGCDPEYTCRNGIQDLNEDGVDCGIECPRQCSSGPMWMIIAGVAILVLLGVWLLVMKQKV